MLSDGKPEDPSRRWQGDIMAVYYHVGRNGSVFLPHSEGILLLPQHRADASELPEEVIVASLVGLLARVRLREQISDHDSQDAKRKGKPFLKRLFR